MNTSSKAFPETASTTPTNSGPKPVNQRPNVRCHRCQELGHYANECPKMLSQLYINEGGEEVDPSAETWEEPDREEDVYYVAPDDVRGECLVSRRLCLNPRTDED
jgi:Zinc knuckle